MDTVSGKAEPSQPELSESVPLEVRVFRQTGELEELQEAWSCWSHHPSASFESYCVQVRARDGVLGPHVVAVYRNGHPQCLLAGWLWRGRRAMNIGGARVAMPQARALRFMRYGFIGNQNAENSRLLVNEVLACLKRGEADFAELNNVPLTSPLYSSANHLPGWLSRDLFPLPVNHCCLTMPADFQDLLAALPRKTRHNYRTYDRRLAADHPGQVELRCFRRVEDMDYVLTIADDISSKNFRRKVGGGFVNDRATREDLLLSAKSGNLRAYLLYIADIPCAFLVGKLHEDVFYAYNTGYDPIYSRYAPGFLILMRCFEDLLASPDSGTPVRRYDFGPGDQRYNRSIANQQWQEATIFIFRRSLKALTIKTLRDCLVIAHRTLRRVLNHNTMFRDRAVRAWRRLLMKYKEPH